MSKAAGRRWPTARLNTPCAQRAPLPPGQAAPACAWHTDHGTERFDDVVLACHSDQSLALLADATREERGAGRHPLPPQPRRAAHRHPVLPHGAAAWAAWNYERAPTRQRAGRGVPALPDQPPATLALAAAGDRLAEPRPPADPAQVIGSTTTATRCSTWPPSKRSSQLPQIQGRAHVWFCGAWTRYGFHEDGLMSALGWCRGCAVTGPRRRRRRGRVTDSLAQARVLLATGEVRHRRLRPARNAFAYRTWFLLLPMRALRAQADPALARNRRCWPASTTATTATAARDALAWAGALLCPGGVRRRRRRDLAADLSARARLRVQAGQLLVLPPRRRHAGRRAGRGEQHLWRASRATCSRGRTWPSAAS
jgi:hypothetical protein